MFGFSRPSGPQVTRLAAGDAIAQAADGALVVIDVREAAELAASGKAAGAHHVPLGIVALRCHPSAPDLPAGLALDQPVAVYCAAGGRSQKAAEMLVQMGYETVYNIGGFGDWASAGGPVER
jgi:rhodanese-related sulfurtransferase